MEERKRCCFAGHSDIWDSNLADKIKNIAEDLIVNHNVKEFWVGNYGTFDGSAAAAIRELQKTYTDIKLDLVIPYLTKSINEYKELYYKKCDNILLPKDVEVKDKYIVKNTDISDHYLCVVEI